MNIVHGSILAVDKGIICHQVNCQRTAGAGLALQIKNKWPAWHVAFMVREPKLGSVGFFRINDQLVIADLYAQFNYGRENQLYTIYDALRQCLTRVREFSDETLLHPFVPCGMGCGLARGNIITVGTILESVLGAGYTTVMRDGL